MFIYHLKLKSLHHIEENLENKTIVKKGEQIFIPGNVHHSPHNLSDKKCIWIVVHSSGHDQDDLIPIPNLKIFFQKSKGII